MHFDQDFKPPLILFRPILRHFICLFWFGSSIHLTYCCIQTSPIFEKNQYWLNFSVASPTFIRKPNLYNGLVVENSKQSTIFGEISHAHRCNRHNKWCKYKFRTNSFAYTPLVRFVVELQWICYTTSYTTPEKLLRPPTVGTTLFQTAEKNCTTFFRCDTLNPAVGALQNHFKIAVAALIRCETLDKAPEFQEDPDTARFHSHLCQSCRLNGDRWCTTVRYRIDRSVDIRYRPQQLCFLTKTGRSPWSIEYRDSLHLPITTLLGVLVP